MRLIKIAYEDIFPLSINTKLGQVPDSMELDSYEQSFSEEIFQQDIVNNLEESFMEEEDGSLSVGNVEIQNYEILEKWDSISWEMSERSLNLWKQMKARFWAVLIESRVDERLIQTLFDNKRAFSLMFYTYQHQGVGIWDGSWDNWFSKEGIKKIQKNLHASKEVSEIGQRLENYMRNDADVCLSKYISENLI